MNPTERFSNRASDYVAGRPQYPAAAIEALVAGLGDPHGLDVADLGAGTGISSRALAERGCRVVAVEPNAAMRACIEETPTLRTHDGTAEHTGLTDASFDLVTAFQAFHWFAAGDALREFVRIARPRGRAALVYNTRDDSDAATYAYTSVVRAYASDRGKDAPPSNRRSRTLSRVYGICERARIDVRERTTPRSRRFTRARTQYIVSAEGGSTRRDVAGRSRCTLPGARTRRLRDDVHEHRRYDRLRTIMFSSTIPRTLASAFAFTIFACATSAFASPDPSAGATALPRPLGLTFKTNASATMIDQTSAGPGTVAPEAAGFIAGAPLAPNTPYDLFSSAPQVSGIAGVGQLLTTANYAFENYDVAVGAGLGYVRGQRDKCRLLGRESVTHAQPARRLAGAAVCDYVSDASGRRRRHDPSHVHSQR